MKKILCITILFLVLIGCNGGSKKEESFLEEVSVFEIEQCGIEWEQLEFPIELNGVYYGQEPIETEEKAKQVATDIIEELHKKGEFSDFVLVSVVHSTNDNIWRFDYSIDQRNLKPEELIDCESLLVAIDGDTGALIKAWVEEG